jgi:hypothetical protein
MTNIVILFRMLTVLLRACERLLYPQLFSHSLSRIHTHTLSLCIRHGRMRACKDGVRGVRVYLGTCVRVYTRVPVISSTWPQLIPFLSVPLFLSFLSPPPQPRFSLTLSLTPPLPPPHPFYTLGKAASSRPSERIAAL